MAERIQLRRGTAANWTTANPVLASGEIGVETDTGKLKVGDGSSAWASRPYVTAAGSMTAAEILTAIKTVDGAGSGLDADLLDGQSSAAFATAAHNHTGTYDPAGTAATAVAAHEADSTSVHGIADTSALVTTTSAPELIRDTMATALVAGTNVTITPNDGADTITITASGGATLPLFGDGSDGDVTISSNTTLSRDMYYRNLTVNGGVTLTTAGYAIWVSGTATITGTISCAGSSATTPTGALNPIVSNTAAWAAGGGGGGNGTTGNGNQGTARLGATGSSDACPGGGASGAGGNGSGGTGGVATTPGAYPTANSVNSLRTLGPAMGVPAATFTGTTSSATTRIVCGMAGGSGGGNGTQNGAGGGAAGGLIMLIARILAGSGTLTVAGGNGAAAINTNTGGGGAGGGGLIYLVSGSTSHTLTLTLTGGTGGAGNGTGTAGGNGSSGTAYQLLGV